MDAVVCSASDKHFAILDMVSTGLSALTGFLAAYAIFRLEQRKAQKLEERRLRLLFLDMHRLLVDAEAMWTITAEDYSRLSRKYRRYPYRLHMRIISPNPAHRALAKLDRLALLSAFKQEMGQHEGHEAWLDFLDLIDTHTEHRILRERAVLSIMKDFNRECIAFDDLCQELRATLVGMLDGLPAESPVIPAIKDIQIASTDVGFVTPDRYYKLIVEPVLELVNTHSLPQPEHSLVLSLMYRAHAMYVRLKNSGILLGTETKRFSKEMAAYSKDAQELMTRMNAHIGKSGSNNSHA